MKRLVAIGLSVGVAWTCSLAGFDAGAEAGKAAAEPAWKVVGQLEEACSCSPACPCWFKSLPSRMTCSGAQIIFITAGHYGSTPLAGLAVAQFAQSPEGQSMFESFGNWKFENSNYMRNEFVVDNKQYEKFEAELAKKMAALKAGTK